MKNQGETIQSQDKTRFRRYFQTKPASEV